MAATKVGFWTWAWPAKNTVDNFSAGKTQLVLLDQSNNFSVIEVKMDGFVLEEK